MTRREFITLIGGAIVRCTIPAMAQDAGRTYRISMLFPFPRDTAEITAVLDELRKQGFIEGQNLAIDYRAWAPHVDLTSAYAAELVKGQPDVFAVGGPVAVRAAQQATKTIPLLDHGRHGRRGSGEFDGPANRQYDGREHPRN